MITRIGSVVVSVLAFFVMTVPGFTQSTTRISSINPQYASDGAIDVKVSLECESQPCKYDEARLEYTEQTASGFEKIGTAERRENSLSRSLHFKIQPTSGQAVDAIEATVIIQIGADEIVTSPRFAIDMRRIEENKALSATIERQKNNIAFIEKEKAKLAGEIDDLYNRIGDIEEYQPTKIIGYSDMYYTDDLASVCFESDEPGRMKISLETPNASGEWTVIPNKETIKNSIANGHCAEFNDLTDNTKYRFRAVMLNLKNDSEIEGTLYSGFEALTFTTKGKIKIPQINIDLNDLLENKEGKVVKDHDKVSGSIKIFNRKAIVVTEIFEYQKEFGEFSYIARNRNLPTIVRGKVTGESDSSYSEKVAFFSFSNLKENRLYQIKVTAVSPEGKIVEHTGNDGSKYTFSTSPRPKDFAFDGGISLTMNPLEGLKISWMATKKPAGGKFEVRYSDDKFMKATKVEPNKANPRKMEALVTRDAIWGNIDSTKRNPTLIAKMWEIEEKDAISMSFTLQLEIPSDAQVDRSDLSVGMKSDLKELTNRKGKIVWKEILKSGIGAIISAYLGGL